MRDPETETNFGTVVLNENIHKFLWNSTVYRK